MTTDWRRHWATALLATLSTLAGATLGVVGTVYVNDSNRDAERASEVRELRKQAYEEFGAATSAFTEESVSFYDDRREHCALSMTVKDAKRPTCVAYDIPEKLSLANDRWIKAYMQLRIYGSSEAVELEGKITDLVKPENRYIRPWGKVIPQLTFGAKEIDMANQLSAAEAELDVLVCHELSGGDLSLADCRTRFRQDA